MSTGYTNRIKDDISFEEFAMNCARAFGACIEMRDEPFDKEIPIFEPDDYHLKALQNAKIILKKLEDEDIKNLEQKAKEEYYNEKNRIETIISDIKKLKVKYDNMLDHVKKWIPPTKDHNGLKNFMIQQIEDSIKWDCDIDYYNKELEKLILKTGQEFKLKEIKNCLYYIKYHSEKYNEEIERVKERNKWISELRNSLK